MTEDSLLHGDSEILRDQKSTLRYMIDMKVLELSEDYRQNADAKMINSLVATERYAKAQNIMIYYPFGREPDLRELANIARVDGKNIYLPRCDSQINMSVVHWRDDEQELAPDFKGIMAPADTPQLDPRMLDIIISPGVGFDMNGGRMGRGAGYYDRFLSGTACPTKRYGVCYDCQLVTGLPMSSHDVKMHATITEFGVIDFDCGC